MVCDRPVKSDYFVARAPIPRLTRPKAARQPRSQLEHPGQFSRRRAEQVVAAQRARRELHVIVDNLSAHNAACVRQVPRGSSPVGAHEHGPIHGHGDAACSDGNDDDRGTGCVLRRLQRRRRGAGRGADQRSEPTARRREPSAGHYGPPGATTICVRPVDGTLASAANLGQAPRRRLASHPINWRLR